MKMRLSKVAVEGASTDRPKTFRRRQDLLGVVYECVSKSGVDGVSMRQLADAAGMSTGSIDYHFKNKRILMISALEAAYELPDDWEEYSGSPLERLKRLANGYVFRTKRDRFWGFWINYLSNSTRDDEMREHQNQRYHRQNRFWISLMRDAIAAGEVDRSINAEWAAEELLLVTHGLVVRQLQQPDAGTRKWATEVLKRWFARLEKT